jgi:Fe-S-cluster-containing dehydrogenase component
MMNKWNLIVDVPLCENCNNCVLAVRDELVGNDFPGYSAPHAQQAANVMSIRRKISGQRPMVDATYLPVMCNHCDDAPCIKAAGNDAIRKRDDGIVIIDPVKAKGRCDLVDACPYGAIVWNEQQQLPQNWFFDAHLLDAGATAPRCAGVCPTVAFEAVQISDADMAVRAQAEGLRTLHPEWGTKPRVHYRHLERFDHCFIGGSISALIKGVRECVEGVEIELRQNGALLGTRRSDAFGDFRFDSLPPDSGEYTIDIRQAGFLHMQRTITLAADSVYLGEIELQYP